MTDPACGLCNDRTKYPDGVVIKGCPVHDIDALTFHVRFSDACTDVLVFLAEKPIGVLYTIRRIAAAISPPYAYEPRQTVSSALLTLLECGLVEPGRFEGTDMWRATEAGRRAVVDARDKVTSDA